MNYRRAFVPNGFLHIIITSYDRKPIFIKNIDILNITPIEAINILSKLREKVK